MMSRQEVLAGYLEGCRHRRHHPGVSRGLLVGQAAPQPRPGSHCMPLFPYPVGCAGERLHRMSGWDLRDYFKWWDRVNTIAWFPGRAASGKGDAFPASVARGQASQRMAEFHMSSRVCLFVGRANASAYPWAGGLPDAMEWQRQGGGGQWAWFPHTSGIVTFWNEARNRELLRGLFDEARQIILSGEQIST